MKGKCISFVILFLILLTGCKSYTFEDLTGITLDKIESIGYCSISMSDNKRTNDYETIELIYKNIDKRYVLTDLNQIDLFNSYSNYCCFIFVYYNQLEYLLLYECDDYIYISISGIESNCYKSTTKSNLTKLREKL